MRQLRQPDRTAALITRQVKGLRVKDVRAMMHPWLGNMIVLQFTNGRELRFQIRPGDYIFKAKPPCNWHGSGPLARAPKGAK